MRTILATLAAAALTSHQAAAKMTEASYFYRTDRPMIVSHRGASGHFPEHSVASYDDSYYGGTDYIELDLQITKDGYLVAQHDSYLDVTTNVAEYTDLFEDKKRAGVYHYYVQDFTLAELKLLKRKQRYESRSQLLNDKFEILTLQEVIDNVRMLVGDLPRTVNADTTVGLYIELKDYVAYLAETGQDMAEMMNDLLVSNDLSTIADCKDQMPIIVQSFDFEALQKYATLSDLPLVQLAHYDTDYDWEAISQVAHGVGPDSQYVMNPTSLTDKQLAWDKSAVTNTYSEFISEMHSLDLAVHPYTLRNDMLQYRGTAFEEVQLYVDKGIDGVFCEFPHVEHDLFMHMGSKAAWPESSISQDSFLQ